MTTFCIMSFSEYFPWWYYKKMSFRYPSNDSTRTMPVVLSTCYEICWIYKTSLNIFPLSINVVFGNKKLEGVKSWESKEWETAAMLLLAVSCWTDRLVREGTNLHFIMSQDIFCSHFSVDALMLPIDCLACTNRHMMHSTK